MQQNNKRQSVIANAFGTYHPTEERLRRAQKEISMFLPSRSEYVSDTSEFQQVKLLLAMFTDRQQGRDLVPVTLVDLNDYSLIGSNNQGVNGGGADMPDFTPGNLEINHNPRNNQPYFNTSLFTIGPLGSPGNSPRRFFYGPGMDNWDIALLKMTHLSESKVLEMRLETFNTFNHAQFFGPTSVTPTLAERRLDTSSARCGTA